MRDYTTKTVYVGVDVHKKTYAVTAICEGQVVKRDSLKGDPAVLITYLKKHFVGAQIESAYEAGFCGFHLHRLLVAAGIKNRVVDAAGMEVAVGDRVKTDKRDSLKIATHLSQGRLKGIHVPSPEREWRRTVTRLRDNIVKQRTRIGNQLKSLLFLNGLISADSNKKISLNWVKSIQALKLSKDLEYTLGQYVEMWLEMDARIKKINQEINEQAETDKTLEEVYRSVPGVGPTSARILANELEDTSQFGNERQLFSYVGLTPTEYSSGEHVRQGHITRQGRPILRKILTQVAWMAVRRDLSLKEIFVRLSKRVGSKKAIIGIARRLVGRIRACFRTGKLYSVKTDPNPSCQENELYDLALA